MDRHSMSNPTPQGGDDDLMAPGEVAALFGVTSRTVQRWAERDGFPSVQMPSGRRKYRRSDIDALLNPSGTADEMASA